MVPGRTCSRGHLSDLVPLYLEGLPSDSRAVTLERVTVIMVITLAPPICLAFYMRC